MELLFYGKETDKGRSRCDVRSPQIPCREQSRDRSESEDGGSIEKVVRDTLSVSRRLRTVRDVSG